MVLLSILHEGHQIHKLIDMLASKRGVSVNRLQLVRAMQLFRLTLRNTRKELEDIYTQYVLKPQHHIVSPALCCLYMVQEQLKNNKQLCTC
jgi:hypothetical protein